MKKRRRAFTLVEMMVVIAIIGIVVTAAVVSFLPFLRGRSLDGASMRVKTAILSARTYAINHRVDTYVLRVGDAAVRMYADSAGTVPLDEPVNMPSNYRVSGMTRDGAAITELRLTPVGSLTPSGDYRVQVAGPNDNRTLWIIWGSCMVYWE
jgi:prepilin-type N-terminal cleavage/methylation domain-containing protein